MPSVADVRGRLELAARLVALAALLLALVRLVLDARGGDAAPRHVRVEGGLAPASRDSLVALARAGDRIEWSGPVSPLALAVEPVRDPSARSRLLVAGAGSAALADSLGPLDSLASAGTYTTAGVAGLVRVSARPAAEALGTTDALARATVGAAPGRVFVSGRVGWEAKFVIAALEESGWLVDARLRLADTLFITQGRAGTPTRATHAAVVALDSVTAIPAGALDAFVRGGGGLVLAGGGAASRALGSLAPARAGALVEADAGAFERGEPMAAIAHLRLSALRTDAVPLLTADGRPIALARRVAAGRVVMTPLVESWRWRMQAERDGPRGHREFWNALVAAAAAAPAAAPPPTDATGDQGTDGAPLASLVQRLGPAMPGRAATPPATPALPAWLGLAALALLLGEWASRRARGAA